MSNSIEAKIKEISKINSLQSRDQWVNNLHPLVKLLLTVIFVFLTVSFDKYNLSGLLVFAVYLFIMFNIADLRFKEAVYRMRIVLPLVLVVGIFNPFFDREIVSMWGRVAISGGMVSMITLMLKGFYSCLAAYVLIATTSIEDICYALSCMKFPKIILTVIMLTYRYIYILIDEANKISMAYSLRAPKQKGLKFKVWGPLVGQWLIRSMDKATMVYSSMCLRGYSGTFSYKRKRRLNCCDVIFFAIWIAVLLTLRYIPVFDIVGKVFAG